MPSVAMFVIMCIPSTVVVVVEMVSMDGAAPFSGTMTGLGPGTKLTARSGGNEAESVTVPEYPFSAWTIFVTVMLDGPLGLLRDSVKGAVW